MATIAWTDTIRHHLRHPFSIEKTNVKLNTCERLQAIAMLLLLPLGILPAIIGFYTAASFLKIKKLKKINHALPITVTNVTDTAQLL